MIRAWIMVGVAIFGVGCSVRHGEQKYRNTAEVDTTGMTAEEAAEARREAQVRARQRKALDDYERTQQMLRDVRRQSRGY